MFKIMENNGQYNFCIIFLCFVIWSKLLNFTTVFFVNSQINYLFQMFLANFLTFKKTVKNLASIYFLNIFLRKKILKSYLRYGLKKLTFLKSFLRVFFTLLLQNCSNFYLSGPKIMLKYVYRS